MSARFVNSGCLTGEVQALRSWLAFASTHSWSVNDDQQLLVRYLLRHPHLLSLDLAQAALLTGYKQVSLNREEEGEEGVNLPPSAPRLTVTRDLQLVVSQEGGYSPRAVAVLHVNNLQASALYAAVNFTVHAMRDRLLLPPSPGPGPGPNTDRHTTVHTLRDLWHRLDAAWDADQQDWDRRHPDDQIPRI